MKLKLFLIAILLPLLVISSVQAQGNNNKESVLEKGQVVNRDYFAAGDRVVLSGQVTGDAYLAGNQVIVDGVVDGDLIAAGRVVDISGRINNDVRVAGEEIRLSGLISDNLTALAKKAEIGQTAAIGGSIAGAGEEFLVRGTVGGNINAAASRMTLDSVIRGDIDASVGELNLDSNARVLGNLNFVSNNPARFSEGAEVTGQVTQNRPSPDQMRPVEVPGGLNFAAVVLSALSTLLVGFILIRFLPMVTNGILDVFNKKLLLSTGIGVLALVLFPILFIFLLLTLVGIPLAFILLALLFIFLYLGKVLVIIWIGEKALTLIRRKANLYWALAAGILVYMLAALIPVAGWILISFASVIGLGAILVGWRLMGK